MENPQKVTLYLYDLSKGLAKVLSPQLTGQQFDGIWHTSVVVYGVEYYYANGIVTSAPGKTHHGEPIQTFDIGETHLPQEVFLEFLNEISARYSENSYDLFENNCNHFSNEVCQFLTGNTIPTFITSLTKDVLNTPLGPVIKQFSEAIANQINSPDSNGDTYGIIQESLQSLMNGNMQFPLMNMPDMANFASMANVPTNNTTQSSNTNNSVLKTITSSIELKDTLFSHKCVIIDFSMSTCPPCLAIAPVFENLIKEKKSLKKFQELNITPDIVGVHVDIHQCEGIIPKFFGISATPTFVFSSNGKEKYRIVGANKNELEAKMTAIVDETFFTNNTVEKHSSIESTNVELIPKKFDEAVDVDSIFDNLKLYLVDTKKISQLEWLGLSSIKPLINIAQNQPTLNVPVESLQIIEKLIDNLNGNEAIPLLQIMKQLVLNENIQKALIMDKNLTLLKLINKYGNIRNTDNTSELVVLVLKIMCNMITSLESLKYLINTEIKIKDLTARSLTTSLLVNSLLSEKENIKKISVSLLYNISINKKNLEDDIEWEIEVLSALIKLLQTENNSMDTLKDLLTSLYQYINMCNEPSIIDLIQIFEVKDLINDMVNSLNKQISETSDLNIKSEKEELKVLSEINLLAINQLISVKN